MNTVKTTLIVVATLIGLALFFFVGSALVAGYMQGKKAKDALNLKFNKEAQEDSIDTRLNAISNSLIGKTVTIQKDNLPIHRFTVAVDRQPFGNERNVGYLNNNDKVKILSFDVYHKKVRIKNRKLTGYIDYFNIKELSSIAVRDTFFNK